MRLRFRIGTLMVVIALVALFVGFFAPELRSWDRNTRLFFTGLGLVTAIALVSFSPVWLVLLMLRKRSRRGLGVRVLDYAVVALAFASSFGIFLAILFAIQVMVAR